MAGLFAASFAWGSAGSPTSWSHGHSLAADQKKLATVNPNPIVTTLGTPTTVPLGTVLSDSATVSGSAGTPTGIVRFQLFDPAGTAAGCNPAVVPPVFSTAPPGGPDPTLNGSGVATVTGIAANTVGTWSWVALYGGETNVYNSAGPTACTAEQVTVVQPINPTITSTPGPANPTPTFGTFLTDSATVSGPARQPTPTGFVQFLLYNTTGTAGGCQPLFAAPPGTPVYNSGLVPLSAAGTASTTSTVPVNLAGTWSWVVNYSGDSVYNSWTIPTAGGCLGEQTTIAKVTPAIATVQKPTAVLVGSPLADTATVSGGFNPTGTVTFSLFAPADAMCSGTAAFTQTVPLAAGSASVTDNTPSSLSGIWHWVATYNGDANNNSVSSGCGEPVNVTPVPAPPLPAVHFHHHASCAASRDPNPNCGL